MKVTSSISKRIVKYLGITILTFILLIAVYLLAAFILSRIEVKSEPETTNDITIFLMTNGVHCDIAVPVKSPQIDWSKDIQFKHIKSQDTLFQYIALGWGDKGFYLETPTWADLKFSTAFKAVFGLSSSAIHATFYKDLKENDYCKKICLNSDQYSRLINYIRNTFSKDENGRFINIVTDATYGSHDAFYEAEGRYNLFRTCNTWTNQALKICGQKAGLWTPFDKGIFYHYK